MKIKFEFLHLRRLQIEYIISLCKEHTRFIPLYLYVSEHSNYAHALHTHMHFNITLS